jgi:hypothetical protein
MRTVVLAVFHRCQGTNGGLDYALLVPGGYQDAYERPLKFVFNYAPMAEKNGPQNEQYSIEGEKDHGSLAKVDVVLIKAVDQAACQENNDYCQSDAPVSHEIKLCCV